MSGVPPPDMAWVRTCDPSVLEEVTLILRELCTQFDLAVDTVLISKWRPLPPHKSPQVGEHDPYGILRANVLRMLMKRGILRSFKEAMGGRYLVDVDEDTVRFVLTYIESPPAPPPPRTPDFQWLRGCDHKILHEALDVLVEVKRKLDLGETPALISAYPRDTDDLDWGEEYFRPCREYRWSVVIALEKQHILEEALPGDPVAVHARSEVVVEAIKVAREAVSPPPQIAAPMQPAPKVPRKTPEPAREIMRRSFFEELGKAPATWIVAAVVAIAIAWATPAGRWVEHFWASLVRLLANK